MTIKIKQTDLESISQLSTQAQALLDLIPLAKQWVQVMLNDKQHTVSFASEDMFIEELGPGLRGTSLIYFPNVNLTADIKKLAEMEVEELNSLPTLSRVQGGRSSDAADNLFTKYKLIGNDAFSLLNQTIQNDPLKWSTTLSDSIQLYNTLEYCDARFNFSQSVKQEAVEWAQSKAQTTTELGHYYCLYLVFYQDSDGNSSTLDSLLAQFIAVALDNLDCPIVTYELDQEGLQQAVIQWNAMGNTLGFTSLSFGLLNIALNINIAEVNTLNEQALAYMQKTQQLLSTQLATDSYIDQAGRCRYYLYSLSDRNITLNLNQIGCLSLSTDWPTNN